MYVLQFEIKKTNTQTHTAHVYVFIVTMLNFVSKSIINSYLNVFFCRNW